MAERKLFRMSDEQLEKLYAACRPTVTIIPTFGSWPITPAERADIFWQALGDELGFDWKTAVAAGTGDDRAFYAEAKS